jgi:predicted ATPase
VISKLELQNFKCFDHREVLLAPFTLLSGLNGTGKSSVLQALLVLRQSHQQGLLVRQMIALNGELTNIGTGKDALYEAAKEDFILLAFTFSTPKTLRWTLKYGSPQQNVMSLEAAPLLEEFQHEPLFGDYFQYLQAERVGPRTSFAISDFAVAQHNQLGPSGEFTAHFLSVFGRTTISNKSLAHPLAASLSLLDQTEAWIGEVCPGVRLNFTSHVDIDLVSLRYSFIYGKSKSNPFRPTNVGFGLTYTLPVLVALLSLPPGGLLLVENPEAHLHPKGQVLIGELLARAAQGGVQVLVETHSDHVLNGVRLAVKLEKILPSSVALHYFERKTENDQLSSSIVSPRIDKNGRLDHWPEGFFDQWDKSLEGLLEP